MDRVLTRLGDGGRLVIPAEYRKALGIDTGDELVLVLEDQSLRVLTPREGIRRAQALVRSYIPKGLRLSEDLIRERREASQSE
jgi:AbrB family looped-hinge helix DNA binding protein